MADDRQQPRASDLEFHICCYLYTRNPPWCHGYRIWLWLTEKRDIAVSLQSIYRVLQTLLDKEWVEFRMAREEEPSIGGVPRKLCRLTEQGKQATRIMAGQWSAFCDRVQKSICALRDCGAKGEEAGIPESMIVENKDSSTRLSAPNAVSDATPRPEPEATA